MERLKRWIEKNIGTSSDYTVGGEVGPNTSEIEIPDIPDSPQGAVEGLVEGTVIGVVTKVIKHVIEEEPEKQQKTE